ncbi:MAG: MBL fold metallo-hydrolase, partial [Lachnospiraceae bacterium]|nr:MBL fold metallo-hydrolase [Lachnospiraceae bacterium]
MGEDPADRQEAWQENGTWQDGGAGQGFTSRSGGETSMEVHFIDVGQGDATLILCDGAAMLIDCADSSQGTRIQDYLQKQGVEKLDYLVLTHPDSDHIGGAPVIIEKFEIDRVFMSNFEKSNKTYMKVIQSLDNRLLKWSTPEVGSTWQLGSAQFTILAPNGTYSDPNEASIALV